MKKSVFNLLLMIGLVVTLAACGSGSDGASGANSMVKLTDEPTGDNCTGGGQRIDVGIDTNQNETLDADEITSTEYLCNGIPIGAPSAPENVLATGGDEQVTVSWDAVTGANSYNLYFSTSDGVTTSVIIISGATTINGTKISGVTSSYTHTGLTSGTKYYYVVKAVNSIGESAVSSEVSATTN